MAEILIAYSSTDGQTRKICMRLKLAIERHAHNVTLRSIDDDPEVDVARFDKVVVGARIRYGKHSRRLLDFVSANAQALDRRPNAFFSVNVVARKPEKSRPETNPYLQRFLRETPWRPKALAVFAGKIDYRLYRFWDKLAIRFIMWMTNGPTDGKSVVEFTNWAQVDAFGELVGRDLS